MFVPQLSLPGKRQSPAAPAVEPRADKVKAWLDQLPLANPFESLRQAAEFLGQVNQLDIPRSQRFKITSTLLPLVEQVTPILRQHYANATLPLSERNKLRLSVVQRAWNEVAHSAKLVIMDTMLTQKTVVKPQEELIPSIRRAIHALTQMLLDTYAAYAPAPPNLWLEIHQLYLFSSAHGIASQLADGLDGAPKGLNTVYKEAVLLGLGDPYHLMTGEVAKVFAELSEWAPLCKLETPPPDLNKAVFIADLELDRPPGFRPADSPQPLPIHGICVDTSQVLRALQDRLTQMQATDVRFGQGPRSTLVQRIQRTLYQRLERAWTARADREAPRKPAGTQVLLASGFSNAHHYVNGGQPFDPERIATAGESAASANTGGDDYDLLPTAGTPWLFAQHSQQNRGVNAPRRSSFTAGQPATDQDDVWSRIYQTPTLEVEESIEAPSAIMCNVRNTSTNGLAVTFPTAVQSAYTRVGDLVALKAWPEPKTSADGRDVWTIGAVRWLRLVEQDNLELGLETLADDSLAVASKAVSGTGQGSEYFRAFLLDTPDADIPSRIVTSPSIYDVDSILALNTGTIRFRVRLTRLMEGTHSYSLFEFKPLDVAQGTP